MQTYENFEFYSANHVVCDAISESIRPPQRLTVSEWADKNRLLESSTSLESGPWKTSRVPYLKEPMDSLSIQDPCTTVTMVCGAQLGKTEAGLNFIGYVIDHAPAPMMYVNPTLEMLRRGSRTRLQPMIENTPCLSDKVKSKDSKEAGNSVDLKEFRGGLIVLTTAGSASGLRSQPCRYLFLDEMSSYQSDVDEEGDPVQLAKARQNNFGRHKKTFQTSTPTIRGVCRIEQEFAKSDQRYYTVPCPFCGKKFVINWSCIKWDTNADKQLIKDSVHCECPSCKAKIQEHYKTWMMAEENGASWNPTVKTDGLHKGYHLSSLYSPLGWNSWVEIVERWIEANDQKRKGNYTALKTFVNTQLGETWEDPASKIDSTQLWSQRKDWIEDGYEIPNGGMYVTAGCDVQDNRLEVSVYAWGENEECWGIEHKVFFGNPSDRSDQVWKDLDDLRLNKTYKHQTGKMMRVNTMCIDSGYLTDMVYTYVLDNKQTALFATKGQPAENHQIIRRSKNYRHGKNKRAIALFNIGTFQAKYYLSTRVQQTGQNVNIHYPISDDFDTTFFEQLSSERMMTKFVNGFSQRYFMLPSGSRNEALDCWILSLAALRIADPNMKQLKYQFGFKDEVLELGVDPDDVVSVETPSHMEQVQQQKRQQWNRPSRSTIHKGR